VTRRHEREASVGLRILIVGQIPEELRRQVAALDGVALHERPHDESPASAIRELSPDLAILDRPAALLACPATSGREPLEHRLEHEFLRSVRYRHPLGLVLVSVDDVSGLSRTHGPEAVHALADALGEAARRAVREVDVVFRPSREEIAAVLPETEPGGARIVAERLRSVAAHLLFKPAPRADARPALPLKATASVGLAGCPGATIRSAADLLAVARKGIEAARAEGGDRVVLAE
jgi:diguanylate cyclase (GGDEF)-like protein